MGSLKNRKVTKIQSQYMEQHEKKRLSAARRKKLLVRRLTVFFIFAGIISSAMISTLISQSRTMQEMKEEQARVEEQLAEMIKEEQSLQEEIVKLNDDEYLPSLRGRNCLFQGRRNDLYHS